MADDEISYRNLRPIYVTKVLNKVSPELDVTVLARRAVSAARPPTCQAAWRADRPRARRPAGPTTGSVLTTTTDDDDRRHQTTKDTCDRY